MNVSIATVEDWEFDEVIGMEEGKGGGVKEKEGKKKKNLRGQETSRDDKQK